MSTLLLLLALGVGEVSKHNDIIIPYNEAAERCHKQGLDWVRVQPKVTQWRETEDKTVLTKVVVVTCKRPVSGDTEASGVPITVNWQIPPIGEPLYYEISLNGVTHTVQGSPWTHSVEPGAYTLSMVAFHKGAKSDPTKPVSFTIEGE